MNLYERIFDRLRVELPGFKGSERTVRGYVQRRRQQLGLERREVFVAQTYAWGSEAHVDWYEAWAILSGERVKLQVFEMRSMAISRVYAFEPMPSKRQRLADNLEIAGCTDGGWQCLPETSGTYVS